MATFEELLTRVLAEVPEGPGVYLMKGADGKVLYVGKAKSLRPRVASYFRESTQHTAMKQHLVLEIADVDVLETDSEVDAFVLESRLIKDIQPKYNIRLRDGKSYPYLAITRREDFPTVFIGREGEFDPKKVTLFGPFTDVKGLRRTLPIFQKVFKFRTCTLDITEGDERWQTFRPCLLSNLSMCSAPCNLRIDKATYRADIDAFKRFLKGNKRPLLKALERKMLTASKALEFERAAVLRDQIIGLKSVGEMGRYGDFMSGTELLGDPVEGLTRLGQHLGMAQAPRLIEGIDIATIGGKESVGSLVCFLDGVPHKAGYRHFRIKTVAGTDDFASIREVVRRRYARMEAEDETFPDLVLIDGGKGQLSAAGGVLSELGIERFVLVSLAKKEEIVYREGNTQGLKLPRNSRALRILQHVRDEAHRFAQRYHHTLRRRATLPR